MSINHYSLDVAETTPVWWSTQQEEEIPSNPPNWLNINTHRFNLNNNDELTSSSSPHEQDQSEEAEEQEKEAMFEKPLTPSDVGKLNRLVIPKQHAEKYFPLGASDSAECKGLLLSFDDESGKTWRFRYSYWNSSQSYVLTKGWSRYVKDKRLDAGDVVSFLRHRADVQRLFIRWRRRSGPAAPAAAAAQVSRAGRRGGGGDGNSGGVGVGWTGGFYCAQPSYPTHHHHQQQQQQHLAYQQHDPLHHAGKGSQLVPQQQRTSPSSSSSSKVLRLFGVNMECQTQHDDDHSGPSTPECSTTQQGADINNHHDFYHNHHHHQPSSNNSNYSPSNSHPYNMVPQQPYYY